MNSWIDKSIKIANSPRYLDQLYSIYPMEEGLIREIPSELKKNIKKFFNEKNEIELIKVLLKADRFPIDDPYIGFFRKKPSAISENPATIKRISKRLSDMGISNILKKASQPRSASRASGQLFYNWLKALGYSFWDKNEFEKEEIGFLNGSDTFLKNYMNENFDCKLNKGIDLVFKKRKKYIIGEGKFISVSGGSQANQFDVAINLLRKSNGKDRGVQRIAVLDGVIWLNGKNKAYTSILKQKSPVLSALLLKEYLESA